MSSVISHVMQHILWNLCLVSSGKQGYSVRRDVVQLAQSAKNGDHIFHSAKRRDILN